MLRSPSSGRTFIRLSRSGLDRARAGGSPAIRWRRSCAGRRSDGDLIEGKNYAKARRLPVDPKTGEERYSGPIGSYDFSTSADKSVSVAWAFANPAEQARIYNAHVQASRDAVGYMADRVGQARMGDGGKYGAEPGHVAWLEFTHHTARRTQSPSTEWRDRCPHRQWCSR